MKKEIEKANPDEGLEGCEIHGTSQLTCEWIDGVSQGWECAGCNVTCPNCGEVYQQLCPEMTLCGGNQDGCNDDSQPHWAAPCGDSSDPVRVN